jgi:predicted GIY-YIG superfamily endonuclease
LPKGSIITGFRRQKNLGEIIAPSKPKRVAGGTGGEGGCFACSAPRACTLHQSGTLQKVKRIQSRYDGAWHSIRKKLTCVTPNVIYYILCPCGHPTDYVGSTGDFKKRLSGHKTEIGSHNWKACGMTRHFGDHHTGDMEVAIANLQVILVDCLMGEYSEKGLKRIEDKRMVNLGTLFTNSRNEVLSNRRRNYGGS